jgi:hypothetical protein
VSAKFFIVTGVSRGALKLRDEGQNRDKRHDRRFIDLAAVIALLVLVTAAYAVVNMDKAKPKLTSRTVPGQTVRW